MPPRPMYDLVEAAADEFSRCVAAPGEDPGARPWEAMSKREARSVALCHELRGVQHGAVGRSGWARIGHDAWRLRSARDAREFRRGARQGQTGDFSVVGLEGSKARVGG